MDQKPGKNPKTTSIDVKKSLIVSTTECDCVYCKNRRESEILRPIIYDNLPSGDPPRGGLMASGLLLHDQTNPRLLRKHRKSTTAPLPTPAREAQEWGESDRKTQSLHVFIEAAQPKYY